MTQTVLYERTDTIGIITLNRPKVLNAINDAWLADLLSAARKARDDGAARAVVVRGAGRAFCAGADLKETPRSRELIEYWANHITPEQEVARVFHRIGKPVLAQVHGYAVGGGLELALLADIRIAAEGSRFGFPEVKVGATVTFGGLYNLARVVGLGRAFEMLYTARLIDATEALAFGLVNRVVPIERLEEEVSNLARGISQHYPLELALTRQSLYGALDVDFDHSLDDEASAAIVSYLAGARKEGMAKAMERIRHGRGGRTRKDA